MRRCKDCSYTPSAEPRVFCPACGAVWHEASPPKPDRKDKAPAPKPVAKPKAAAKPTAKTTSGRAKRNPTKKKG